MRDRKTARGSSHQFDCGRVRRNFALACVPHASPVSRARAGKQVHDKCLKFWSGRRDSNPRPQPWQVEISAIFARSPIAKHAPTDVFLHPRHRIIAALECTGVEQVRTRAPASVEIPHDTAVDRVTDFERSFTAPPSPSGPPHLAHVRIDSGKSRAEQAPNDCTYFARVVPAAFRRSVPFGADTFTCGVEDDSEKRCVSNA